MRGKERIRETKDMKGERRGKWREENDKKKGKKLKSRN